MSGPGPLLLLTRPDGVRVHIHTARIVKITPADPDPETDADPAAERGSIITVATGTGTTSIGVTRNLLHRGSAELARFLLLTDLYGMPIMINPAYVTVMRLHGLSSTMLEVCSPTGTEEIQVQDSLETVADWWAEFADARLLGR